MFPFIGNELLKLSYAFISVSNLVSFFLSPYSCVCRLTDSYAVCTANTKWTLRLNIFVTALQSCMNTPSEGAYEPVFKHIDKLKFLK